MTTIRLGFVSNSSSSSFVIPKKILTQEEIENIQELSYETSFHNEEIHETEHYFYGRISRDNTLNSILKLHESDEGVEYYEG